MTSKKLTATNLTQRLWETIEELKDKKIEARSANSIATQSREIVRVIRMQLNILSMKNLQPTKDLLAFIDIENRN